MPKTQDKPVHVGSAWRVILHDLGLDRRTILRRVGLPDSALDGDGSFISVDDFYALHEAIDEEVDDPTLALEAGNIASTELFDPAFFAAICSPDMNAAATRLGQFKRLVGAFTLDVTIDEDETTILYRCKHRPDVTLLRGLSEVVFLVAFARRATRHEIAPRRVTVQTLPRETDAYTEYFGCPLEEGDHCVVVLDAEDAGRPFLTHNEKIWESFEPSLQRRMAEADTELTTSERIETALFELLPSGRSQLSDVARELAVGTRTLQRRLAAEDTSWLEVLNRTRERLALYYLENSQMNATEISFLLGFEDPNSLFRAFQRWTGTTPESWRADTQLTH